MNATDLFALLPLLLLAGTPVVVMVAITVRRSHLLTLGLTLMGLAASFISLWVVAPLTPRQVTPLLILDRYALFYVGLMIAATFAVALLSFGYLEIQAVDREEFYVLLLVAALGSSVLVASSHFASFFLGLEILSVSLYSLNAYLHTAVPWFWSLARLHPDMSTVVNLPGFVKVHFVTGFAIILLFPFTRLVHLVMFPVYYLWRPYQVVIWNHRPPRPRTAPTETTR